MKKFCKSLREDTKSVIDFEKETVILLTRKELKLLKDAEKCCI